MQVSSLKNLTDPQRTGCATCKGEWVSNIPSVDLRADMLQTEKFHVIDLYPTAVIVLGSVEIVENINYGSHGREMMIVGGQ